MNFGRLRTLQARMNMIILKKKQTNNTLLHDNIADDVNLMKTTTEIAPSLAEYFASETGREKPSEINTLEKNEQ